MLLNSPSQILFILLPELKLVILLTQLVTTKLLPSSPSQTLFILKNQELKLLTPSTQLVTTKWLLNSPSQILFIHQELKPHQETLSTQQVITLLLLPLLHQTLFTKTTMIPLTFNSTKVSSETQKEFKFLTQLLIKLMLIQTLSTVLT